MSTYSATPDERPRFCSHPAGDQRLLYTARDYISGDAFAVRRCDICGLVRTQPMPGPSELQRYYPPTYYGKGRRFLGPIEGLLHRRQRSWARFLEAANGGRVGAALDIGCGKGLLLDALRRRGWETTGTELSEDAARYARDTLHLRVHVGREAFRTLPSSHFDAIVLWHVLEHVHEPASMLEEIHRLLRPGGGALIAVPNVASLEARLWRRHWFHLDVPRHLHHFSPRTLQNLVRAAGLRPQIVGYTSPEYDYFSGVQSALNAMGLRQNALYGLLRAPGAHLMRRDRHAMPLRDVAASLALAPLLGAFFAPWPPIAGRLRRGATVILYARKQPPMPDEVSDRLPA